MFPNAPSYVASYFKNRLVLIAFEQALNAATEEKKIAQHIFFLQPSPKKLDSRLIVFVLFFLLRLEKCRHTLRTKFDDLLMKRKSIYSLHGILPPPIRLSELYNSMRCGLSAKSERRNNYVRGWMITIATINLELPLSERSGGNFNALLIRCRIFIFDHESLMNFT